MGRVTCDHCEQEISHKSRSFFLHHLRQHTTVAVPQTRPKVCEQCAYTSKESGKLWSHSLTRHADWASLRVCDDCSVAYSNLHSHVTSTHLRGLQASVCDDCGQRLRGSKSSRFWHYLRRHVGLIKVRNVTTFTCDACDKAFRGLDNLSWHVKTRHLKTARENTKPDCVCDVCSMRCKGRHNLVKHNRRKHAMYEPGYGETEPCYDQHIKIYVNE